MKALYQQVTGDTTAHQRSIDAHLRKQPARRREIIRQRLAGASLSDIAGGLVTKGQIQKDIQRTCEAIRKAIAGEPRYNKIGHTKVTRRKKGRPEDLRPAA